jgi:hypothetical protein
MTTSVYFFFRRLRNEWKDECAADRYAKNNGSNEQCGTALLGLDRLWAESSVMVFPTSIASPLS